MRTQTPKN